MSTLSGIATCYDAKTGKEHWKERLGGQFSSSPIAIGGLVFYQSEAGETVVIEPGPALRIVARNSLGAERWRTLSRLADAAAADGSIRGQPRTCTASRNTARRADLMIVGGRPTSSRAALAWSIAVRSMGG